MPESPSHLDANGFVIIDKPDPVALAQAVVECELCDDDGYRGTRVCDHREHSTPAGRAAAKAALRQALNKGGAE